MIYVACRNTIEKVNLDSGRKVLTGHGVRWSLLKFGTNGESKKGVGSFC